VAAAAEPRHVVRVNLSIRARIKERRDRYLAHVPRLSVAVRSAGKGIGRRGVIGDLCLQSRSRRCATVTSTAWRRPPPPGPEDVAPECCNERQAGQVKTPEMSAKTQNACETLRQTMEPLAFTRLIGRGVQRPSLTSAAEVLETGFCEDCV